MKYLFLFSPTGGVARCASALTAAWDGGWTKVDLCDRNFDFASVCLTADDLAVVAVPSYGGRVPGTAIERLAKIQGGGAPAVLLCVYGNRAFEDTLVEMQDVLTDRGFRCIAAVTAIAEHSIMRNFATGRPAADDRLELAAYGTRIRAKLEAAGETATVDLPGNRPYKFYPGGAIKPQADPDVCVRCGLCAKQCPVGAIDPNDPTQTDHAACIACLRCIAICPMKARSVDNAVVEGLVQKIGPMLSGHKENGLYL